MLPWRACGRIDRPAFVRRVAESHRMRLMPQQKMKTRGRLAGMQEAHEIGVREKRTYVKNYKDMRKMIKNWRMVCCGLAAAFASCTMMHDDLEDCPIGLYLSFKYDYNLQRADMFNDHVGAVTVYVFDEKGRYVTKQEEANTAVSVPLTSPLYTMHMNLAPGRYKFLVLAGQKDYEAQLTGNGANFMRTEPAAGDPMEGSLHAVLDHVAGADGYEVPHGGLPLDTLWHGMEMREVEISATRPTYDTIFLVRDTKSISISLREIDDPTKMDVAKYDFRIEDRNAHILWDNSLDETDRVTYTPYAAWNTVDRIPATDPDGGALGEPGRIAHVEFMTSRILYHEDVAEDGVLTVTNRETGVEVIRVNLPDMLCRLRKYADIYRYSEQEFLDRGYDYQMDFFLKGGELAYVNIGISVLNWSVRVQFEEL